MRARAPPPRPRTHAAAHGGHYMAGVRSCRYYDEKATRDAPRWWSIDVAYERELERFLPLEELKAHRRVRAAAARHRTHCATHRDATRAAGRSKLEDMPLFTRPRLSCQPVSAESWEYICELARAPPPAR